MIQASSRIRWRVGVVLAAAAIALASVPTVAGASVVAKNKKKNKGTIGYVVAGDRNDGGFYQGQVESVTKTGKKLGYKVIVVDKVNPGAAQEAFQNLCRQAPKLIIGGGSELTDGFVPVAESPECSKISWVLVAGFPPTSKSYATVGANENQAHYMGGVAAGLLLQQNGGSAGVCRWRTRSALRAVDGGQHEGGSRLGRARQADAGDAHRRLRGRGARDGGAHRPDRGGCTVFYPYLGGALPAANDLATRSGIGVISTSVNLCGVPKDQIGGWNIVESILYNPALYLPTVLKQFSAGKIKMGKQFALYGVGASKKLGFTNPNDGPGAVVCNATADQQKKLDEVRSGITSGKIKVENVGS